MTPTALHLVVESLGWTILHFVWQGAVVAAVLFGLLAAARRASPQVRYGLACGALLVAVAAFGGTLAWEIEIARPAPTALVAAVESRSESIGKPELPVAAGPAIAPAVEIDSAAALKPLPEPADLPIASAEPWPQRLRAWLPLIDGVWAAGVALLSLRLCASWQAVRRLCSSALPIDDPAWVECFAAVGRRLNISRRVRLVSSASAGVPFVVGCLRPMILVPAGLLSGLTPAEVEAILAHELAHVRRHDFLVNLVQNVAETLLFYHPAVWWISAQIRREREHCCDDVAAAACGGALDYAKALVAVEQLRPAGNLLVAASGGSLVWRIRRLAGVGPDRSASSSWPLAALVLLVSAALAVVAVGRLSLAEPEGDQALVAVGESTDDAPSEPLEAGIAMAVIDVETKEPIPHFRILHGVKNSSNGSSAEQFREAHEGLDLIVWYRETIRLGENGAIFWPAKEWDSDEKPIVLRVEAEGYEPAMSAWLPKPNGAPAVVFRLVKDTGLTGRVMQPDGQPAAGATVAIALAGKWTRIENGRAHLVGDGDPPPEKLSEQWALPVMAKTDSDGRFHMPGETDSGAVVLVVHESGVTEMSLEDFRRQPEVRLKPWGRVVGQVWWKDHPGVGEPIELSAERDLGGYGELIRSWNYARTDVDGKFDFEKVLPGPVDISRRIEAPPPNLGLPPFEDIVTIAGQKVDVNGTGQITSLVLGGQGRTVTGRLTGRESWKGVTVDILPSAPRGPSGSRMWQALRAWDDSTIGPIFFFRGLSPDPDGSLKIRHVLPGSYEIYISTPNDSHRGAIAQFTVEAEQPGVDPPALDVGEIAFDPLPPQGDQAPADGDKPADGAADEVDLPEPGLPAGDPSPVVHLTLGREPSGEVVLRLHGQKIDEATLKRLAQAVADGKQDPAVLLAAEQGATYQEVVKVIDLLSSSGLKKVSLETRRPAVDDKPGPPPVGVPARFSGAEVIALVGPEVILASDVLPDAERQLQSFLDTGMVRTTPDAVRRLRELHLYRIVERRIDIKLIVAEGRRLLPKEAWPKIERQFGDQFDKEYLPKLRKQYQCDSRRELDAKLRKMGISLEGVKRQSMENSFAQYWLEEKVKVDVTSDDVRAYRKAHSESNKNAISDEAAIRKNIHDERFPVRRKEYLAGLRKRVPVWTVFDGAEQAETEQPDPAAAAAGSGTQPPSAAKTADQPASGEKPDAESPPAPMTDTEVAALPGPIKLVVLDPGKKPIPRFRVMTAIQPRQVAGGARPLEKWGLCPVIIGRNGACDWLPPLDSEDDEYLLEIEADGYEPRRIGPISWSDKTVEVEMRHETPIALQVLEAEQSGKGRPAAGATVAIPKPHRHAILENAHILGDSYAAFQNESAHWGQPAFEAMRLRRPWLVKTDSDGRCTIPSSARFGPLLVVHPDGAALITDETAPFRQITLRPWAVVHGKVVWQDKPGAGERIGLSTDYFGGMISRGPDDVTSDENGSFEFHHVLPGVVHLTRFVPDDGKLPDGRRFSFPGLDTYVNAPPMVSTYAQIGGQGRTVVGRLVGRKDWSGVTVSFVPPLPAEAESDVAGSIKKLRDLWADSPIGPIFFRTDLKPAADGSFELPRVLPGRYELTVSTPQMPGGGAARAEATIEPEGTGENRARIDLGDIDVASPAKFGIELKPGELYRGDLGDGPK